MIKMPKLSFIAAHITAMKATTAAGHQDWGNARNKPVKDTIKTYKRIMASQLCCYCQRDINEEFKMVLDLEHIIPKSVRPKLMFNMKNISVSCKKCNMHIKKDDTSFLTLPVASLPNRAFKSRFYKFAHPNLDKVFAHIQRVSFQLGPSRLVKYTFPTNSAKGKFTYKYFKLKKFELDKANLFQGRTKKKIDKQELAEAFAKLNQ